jgi:predicted kinase
MDGVTEQIDTALKELVIMRGLPSSGKSYRAKEIAGSVGVVLSTDEYFYKLVEPEEPTKYSFRPNHVGFAHKWNQVRAQKLIEEGHPLVIIDNTNTMPSEAKAYVQYAVPQGYTVRFEEPTSPWWLEHAPLLRNKRENKAKLKEFAAFLAKKSEESHNVPAWALERMLWRWVPDITVESVLASPDM